MSALAGDTETQGGTGARAGAALPSIAGNSDFSEQSVAISGQSGSVSPLAGVDMDRLRDAMETMRAQGGMNGGDGPGGGLFGGGGFGGGPVAEVRRFGGFGGGGGGGGRGGLEGCGISANFKPGQPHGAIFWMGSNSALNAEPFSLRGQPQDQPASGTNRFGLTFISAPYIPGLTKPSGKDTVFLTLSGSRNSNPLDEYATVPTDAQRAGDFSAAGLAPIFDPLTKQQFSSNGTLNVIPQDRISPQAKALLQYFPEPNIAGAIAELSSAVDGAVELDAGRNSLHAEHRCECLAVRIRRAGGWRRRAKRGAAEPGTAAEHECQLQLEPFGFRQCEPVSATGREDGVGFGFAAGWLHDRVPAGSRASRT